MPFRIRNKPQTALLDALEEPALIFSEDGRFLYANMSGQEALFALGYSESKRPQDYDILLQNLFLAAGTREGGIVEIDGQRYQVSGGLLQGGQMLRLLPVPHDAHLERLSSLLKVMPWGLITVDLSGAEPTVVYTNPRAGEFFKADHARMIGLPLTDVARVLGLDIEVEGRLRDASLSRHDQEVRVDGRICWYRLHFIPSGDPVNICLIVIEDTTESKIMEGQYFQSQRLEALGQLAGGVAHDFNNILSIIDGYARMARKTVDPDCDTMNYLERIKQAVERGSALTGQLLTFGRHKVVKDKVINLGELVRDQEPLLRPLMDASIALSINTDDQVYIEAPPDNICQILLNLCVNSRDAMPDGGNLIIEARAADGHAYLRVIDTGSGMPPDVRAKMFDPFFTTKDQGKGTGLGLSMVYGLVRDMKGEIDVISQVGKGTSITIALPLCRHSRPVPEIRERDDGTIHMEGFTALVAEDEPDLLHLLSGMLEDMGIKVIKACNGNEALMLQEDFEGTIDFLVTDVVMPELNGVRLAEMFQSLRPSSKVLFLSGYPANGLMARIPIPDGAIMMSKPVDMKKLGSAIRSMAMGQDNEGQNEWRVFKGEWRNA